MITELEWVQSSFRDSVLPLSRVNAGDRTYVVAATRYVMMATQDPPLMQVAKVGPLPHAIEQHARVILEMLRAPRTPIGQVTRSELMAWARVNSASDVHGWVDDVLVNRSLISWAIEGIGADVIEIEKVNTTVIELPALLFTAGAWQVVVAPMRPYETAKVALVLAPRLRIAGEARNVV